MKALTLCILGTLCMLTFRAALADDVSLGSTPAESVSGTIVATSAAALVILTADGERLTFQVDDASRLPADGSMVNGSKVKVAYHRRDDGTLHAAQVTREAPQAPPREAPETLPHTGSPLQTVGLVGLLAVAVAVGVRASRSL